VPVPNGSLPDLAPARPREPDQHDRAAVAALGMFALNDYVQRNPEAVKRFASATYEAGRWANTHPDDLLPRSVSASEILPHL
jgi:hypothetical protein